MIDLHIVHDEIGCNVFIKTYWGCIKYYTENEPEEELKDILVACQPKENFKEQFYNILKLHKMDEPFIECKKGE